MALATNYSTSNTAGVNLTDVWSALANTSGTFMENVAPYPPFQAGTVIDMLNGGKAVYVKLGTGGVTGTSYAILMPSAGPYTAAVMMSASVGLVGDKIGTWLGSTAGLVNDYGWVQVYGLGSLQTAASVAANTALLGTATAGQLSSAGTHAIANIFLTTAAAGSAGVTACEMNWPTVTS